MEKTPTESQFNPFDLSPFDPSVINPLDHYEIGEAMADDLSLGEARRRVEAAQTASEAPDLRWDSHKSTEAAKTLWRAREELHALQDEEYRSERERRHNKLGSL